MIDQAYAAAREAILAADTDEVTRCTAIALMAGYTARWSGAEWQTIAVEEEFHLPLVNPNTGATSRTFTWAGKRDARAFNQGRKYVVEHKTTSEDIQDPNAPYFRQLTIDSQVSAYALASWQEEEKVDGTLYDVIRKPTIRPKKIAQKERAAIASLYTYHNFKVSQESRDAIVGGLESENGELYGLRLQADIAENPNRYYQRRIIMRLDHELVEFADELWSIGQEIRQANLEGKHYRNSGACMLYGRPCLYLALCSGFDTEDSDRWVKRENPHSELEGAAPNALTHSRIRCFQTCRRKAHYRYNLGLVRPDEDAEALRFGTLLHKALEAYWAAFIPSEKNHVNSAVGFAANEVAIPSHTGSQA